MAAALAAADSYEGNLTNVTWESFWNPGRRLSSVDEPEPILEYDQDIDLPNLTCVFAIVGGLDSVFYNGTNITEDVTMDVNGTYHVAFPQIYGATLAITARAAVESYRNCFREAIQIECISNVTVIVRDPLPQTVEEGMNLTNETNTTPVAENYTENESNDSNQSDTADVNESDFSGNITEEPNESNFSANFSTNATQTEETGPQMYFIVNRITSGLLWHAYGSSFPVDAEHQAGEGFGWQMPCASTADVSGPLEKLPKIWAQGYESHYATFRWNPLNTMSCNFTMNERVESAFYNNTNITMYVEGNFSDPTEVKTVEFGLLPEGFLVFTGQGSSSTPCANSSFQISCSNNVTSADGWEATGSSLEPPRYIQAGQKRPEVWDSLCKSTAASSEPPELAEVPGIWADGEYASFRWSPVPVYWPPPVVPPPSLTCVFAIFGSLESVFYNGTNVTDLVEDMVYPEFVNDTGWHNDTTYFKLILVDIPYATLAITATGNSSGDACSTAALQMVCDFDNATEGVDSRFTTGPEWQTFGSPEPIDDEHQSGEGSWWDVPCSSSAPAPLTTFDGRLSSVPSIWASGHKYASFRWVPSDLVKCHFSLEQFDSLFYGGQNFTDYVEGNQSDPSEAFHLEFAFHEHAYLVISGQDISGAPCTGSSLRVSCSNGIITERNWEAFGAGEAIEDRYKAGLGLGWRSPCTSTAPSEWISELTPSASIWATGGTFAAFRWKRPERVKCQITSHVVEAVYYNGVDLTPTLTGDLLEFNDTKTFEFRHVQEAYLAITVKGAEGSCSSDGFFIICSNGVTSSRGWQAFQGTPVDITHRQGGGAGWTEPCHSSLEWWPGGNGRYLPGLWSPGATEVTFRWLDMESWELALKAGWEDGTFNYNAQIWQDGSSSTFGTGAAYRNTKTEAYSQLKVKRVKLVVDNMAAVFSLPADVQYRYTLQELASAHDSSVFRAALSQRGLEATGFAAAHLGDARTCGFGFDLRSSSSVRLGILLGNSDCSAETGSEGLGLLQSGSNLGSGLLEGGQQVWGRVEVFVEGPALQQNEVRLSEISEGRVEIFKDSQWGTIDDSLFDNLDAAVICRQLSFFGGMKLPSDQVLQSFQLTPAMSNVSCMGYEREVAACSGDLVEKELRAQIGMSGTDAGVRCLRESVLEVMWVGCYADDYYHDLDFGPQATGYNTRTCAEACQDFRYMALQNGGWCSCGDHFSTSAQYLVAADSECGNLCSGEELLSPSRYCGGFERNAIYALKKGAFQPGLLATYYTFNQGCTFQDLTFRTPDESRIDADVNYEATRNPWAGFTFADHFAAQWNGFLVLDTTGSYTFQLDSDDGSRMYLEGVQIIDHDGCRATSQVGPVTPPKQYSKQMLKGHYEIKLEHFENTWEAKMIFALQRPSDASPEPVPASQLRSSPGLVIPGVRADFFAFTQSCSFQDLEERIPNASRVDPLVEYVLGNETHAQPWRGLVFANDFAARWMGYILITSPGTYIFQVEAADCHRFSVDDVYLVERPGCHPFESNNGTAVLTEGFHRVTLEYFEKSEASSIRLSYSGPDTQEAMKVVPSEVLWSSAGTLQVGTNTKFYVTFQSCNTFMDLSSLIPDVLRFDQQIDYPSSSSAWTGLSFADHFAVSWAGFIIITFPGKYTFQVNVEDGARLLVEKVLVAASAACGAQTLTASLELVQGYHYFELQYFEVTGNAAAILSYQGPDTSNVMTVIPSSVLRYSPDTLVPTEGQVQLRGITSGRLEIYHNHQWGTVCDDNFDDVDALVVCRQLGFSTGRSLGNSVPEGAGPIWMDEVNCLGNETRLDQCSFLNWGEHDCAHSEDVGVDCTQDPVLPVEGDLRLSGGNIGRLDVYHAGTWGTVCNSGFTDAEARVACRQMGYCCGILSQSTAPVGTGPIWLADLQCVGYEQRLDECGVSTGSWGNNTCTRSQDVAINCMDGASCLASGTHLYSPGDVGLKIYVSGINVVQPKATLPSIAEFVLTCPSCSKDTTVFLASSCNETEVATGMRTEEALLENSTSLSQWSTYLNTTELLLGQYFRLCVDADGAGTTLAIGDAGHEIYLQLLSVLTGVVLAAPLQRVDVRAEDVNNTNFQMFLSVAAEGCAIELNSAQPPPVKRTHIGTPLLVNGNVWSFEVDASGLEIGDHAVVCEDYDADTGPLRPGPASGPQVYVSGAVVTTSETIRRRPLQYIYLQCAAGCDTRSWGFLATDCDAPMPGRKTAGAHFQGVAPSFNLTLDATDLEAGYRYLLCTDLDGPMTSRLKAGPAVGSGPFVAGVELVRTHFIQALDAELVELVCSADCRGFVSGVSTIFLSLASCTDVEPGFLGNESTTLSVLTGLPPTFSANVNASGLKTGLRYQVCVDLDGAGAEKPSGYSLFDVYVSGVISVISPPAVRTSSDVQTVVLECLPDECSEASTAFLAAGCTISANQGPPLRTSEVSFLPTNNATLWEVNFPLVGLTMGTNYRICVDMDGSPGLAMASINSTATGLEFPIGESGLSLYVAPLGPSLPPPSTIRSEMNQEVLARCVTQPCRTLVLPGSTATAFLAAADVRCSEAQALTPHSTLRNHPSLPDAWLVTFDARSLTEGRTYRLCIDADGSRSTLQAGDSLVNVFISPLQASGSTVMPEQLQQVSLPCVSACVAALAAPFAYLVAKAPEDERGCTTMATPFEMPVLLSSHQASHIVATFNASKLIAGYHYELCLAAYRVLEDEPEAGMSGALIFVSGITAARGVLPEPQGGLGVQTAAGQGLVLSCGSAANCSTDSEVFLVGEQSTGSLLTAAGAALTSPAALTPVGQEWFVTIDASSLTAGKYYLLCVDLFGIAPPGCTGFMVFASSLSASTQSVGFAGSQLVTFSCASGCISSSSVYLARDCSTGYGGPKTVPTPIVATHGNLWTAVHQADALISGFRYQMCVDMDGSGALPTGPSGVVVYVSGVSRVFPSYVSDDLEQKVVLECGEEMPCRASRARLVRDSCSSNTSDATEWRSISAGVNGSILNVLTDGLAAGAHYILCTEMEAPSESFLANETLDVGDSGFTLYVSPLQAFGPMILLPTQQQVLTLNCTSSANCTSKTQGFLSQSCGSGGPLAPMMNEMADRTSAATLEVENEMLAQWRLTLDTSQLIPGRHYKLCVDMDGGEDSFQPGQSSSIQIFISPVIPADVQTVKTIQDQRISMQCVNGAACSTTSVWYLTTGSCGEPGDASLQPQPMSLLQAVGRLAFGGQAGHWMAQLDGRQLQAGVHYRLCLDLDSAGALWAGDTGLEVYASGILSLAPAQIMISATERVNLTCVAGGCLSGAMLWLASRCETPLTSLERFASIQATEAAVVFDTTAVQAGQWLELCSDLDGQESLRYGSTGLYVYISGILAVNDPWMQTWVGRLTLDCATSACSSGAEAFLALDCGSRPGQVIQTPAAQLQDVPDLYEDEEISSAAERKEIVLNLQILVPGVHYRLCTDLDGSGPMTTFYSGFDVYVTSLRQATPDLVVKRQVQQSVLLECDPSGCPPNTAEAFAAENCSTDTPPSGARLMQSPSGTLRRIATVDASTLSSRWYNLCIDVDGQASSGLQAGAVGNIFVSPISQIFPLTLGVAGQHPVKIECSTCTEETQVFLSLTCLLQNASNVTALLPSLPGNSWTAMLTTYHTEPGLFYQLCVVVENVTGPSGEALFVAPDVSLQQEAILRNQMQLISLDCKRGCASLTHVTLATECSRWDTMQQAPVLSSNVISSPTAPTTSSGGIFLASLDASTMPAGQIVTLCLGSQDRAMGEGGLSLFVSPISATSTSVIFNAPSQSLQLNCTGCSTLSEVYLALNCSVNASSATNRTPAAPLIASGGGYQWAAQLDATHLEPGIHYEICIDLDGEELTDFPSGKAMWQVYASAFSSPGHFSLPLSPNSQLKVPCLGCSSAQGFLADSCPSRNLQPEDAVNYSNASRFTDACLGGSEAATDATSFVTSGEEFVLQLDTCSLAPGSHLPLCTDMDGFSSRLQIGDSGIEVYVSPVTSSVGPSRLVKGQSSVLTVACTGCISGLSTAQLAIECDESPNAVPLAISPNSTSAVQLQEGSQGFTASFDTRGLGSGRQYRVCLDLDGAGTQYRAGDSGISMYLTAIASISFDEREESEPSQFGRRLASVAAGRVLELVMLCLPGGGGCGTESEGFLSLMGECTPISPAQQLQKLPSFYGLAYERFGLNLSTAALPAGYTYQICVDADGPGIIFPAGETGYTIYISPVRMAVSWGSVLRLVCEPGGCGSSTSGFLAADCTDSTKPMGAMGRMYAVAGRPKPWPEILYLTNESAMVTAEHWESSIDAPPGHPMRLCLDVDGSGPMPIGDARGIYTSSVQELFTHGVPQGLDEVITLACHATGSCSETTQAYLAKTCDIHDLDAGTIEVLGEQTACSFLVPDNSSEAANETEVFSVHLRTDGLAAGWHYRLCMDLDGSALAMPTGDTLHQVYLSPVREVEPMKSAGYVQLRFNCSECSQLSEGFLALDCYEGALVLQPLNGNMSEDSDGSSSEVDPANFTGATFTGSSAFMLDALGGNWTLGISTQTLHGGVRYRFCMDLDGIDRQYLVGDTGLTVFISPITDVRPVVLAASNSSLTLLCQRGGCSFLLHSYLARDCQAPPSPSQCSYVQEDVEETNESNDTNGTNESNVTQFVDPQLGPPIQVESSPLSSINALGSAEFSADLDLTCTKPGRYRLCIVGQEETTFGAIATHIEDSGFYIDVV